MVKDNDSFIKIRSLMERMDNKGTYFNGMLLENQLINEAKRVNVDTFLQFMTKYQIHKGPFVRLGYIQLYETDTLAPSDELYDKMSAARGDFEDNGTNLSRFDKFMNRDRSDIEHNEEWFDPQGPKKRNQPVKTFKNKLYPYIMKLTTYDLHWQLYKDYTKKMGGELSKMNGLKDRMDDTTKAALRIKPENNEPRDKNGYYDIGDELGKYGVQTFSTKKTDGTYEPIGQSYRKDVDDPDSETPYERTAVQNFLSDVNPQRAVYFGVDENGYMDPIPKSLGKLLHNPKDPNYDLSSISDPEQIELANEFIAGMKNFNMANKTFMMYNVAYVAGRVTDMTNGNSECVYWINPSPLFLLNKEKQINKVRYKWKYQVHVNEDSVKNALNRFVKSDADELEAMGNPNIN